MATRMDENDDRETKSTPPPGLGGSSSNAGSSVPPPPPGLASALIVAKKPAAQQTTTMIIAEAKGQLIVGAAPARTSSLQAPTMLLSGHEKGVHCVKFNPSGKLIASAGEDNKIFLWEVYGECKNTTTLKGHSGVVLDLQWNRDGEYIYTVSSDKTGAVWDVNREERVKRFRDHTSFVNAIQSTRRGPEFVATGSDDCTAMLWDVRVRHHTKKFIHDYQVTSVAFSDDSTQLFTGSVDDNIYCWDIRKGEVAYTLKGHADTVTGLSLSPDGSYLLSNGMDNMLRSWDVRSYVSGASRLHAQFTGATHDASHYLLRCSWSKDGTKISCGSADRLVYVWEYLTGRTLYKLPGHVAHVLEVDFHPTEPVIASCGIDKNIYVGEIIA